MYKMYPGKPRMEALPKRNSSHIISRELFKLLGEGSNYPNPRKSKVAAVAKDSCGETLRHASQRPLGWTLMKEEEL